MAKPGKKKSGPKGKKKPKQAVNDGRKLEELVTHIEAWMAPGFEVGTRRKIFNDEGIQIAELDIELNGRIGTCPYRGLIECRDRPSEGAAPVGWIEQLVGRRQRFGYDKVMAVSTTGFAPGAKEFAESVNIELRSLEELTYETVSGWLPFYAPLVIQHAELSEPPKVFLISAEAVQVGPQYLMNGYEDLSIFDKFTSQGISMKQIWECVDKGAYFAGMQVGEIRSGVTIRMPPEQAARYELITDTANIPVNYIEFTAKLKLVDSGMPLSIAARYVSEPSDPDSKETFVMIGQWKGQQSDFIQELTIMAIPKKEKKPG